MLSSKRIKLTVLALLVMVLAITSYQVILYWNHRGLVKINVVVLPSDSQLKIDGAPAKAGAVYLKPGVHTLSATREYFEEDKQTIDTNKIKRGERIYILPKAISSEAKMWLEEHPGVQRERESAGGEEAAAQQTSLINKYPVLGVLPEENSHYKIDYAITKDKLEFTINLFGVVSGPDQYAKYTEDLKQYKNEALKFLQDHKINPQDHQITYIPDIK